MEPNPVQTQGVKNKRYPIGICYVIIPENVDRGKYVQDCYRRGMISVQCEDGSNVFNARITTETLQVIDFPSETKQLGSALVYNTEYHHNIPIIKGRLLKDDESTNLTEHEFRFEKYTETGSVSISGKAKEGNLFIKVFGNVSGETEADDKTGGKIFIDVINESNNGGIEVNLQGNFRMELQSMILNILKGLNISTIEDANINSKEGVINLGDIEDEDVTLEPLLLGTKTVDELSKEIQALTDLITSIANIIPANVTTGAPDPTWAVWQAAVATIVERGDLSEVSSDKTFTE